MIIEWLEDRILVISVLANDKEKKAGKGKKIYYSGTIKLQPGCNHVDDDLWQRAESSVNQHIEDKKIIVHNTSGEDGKKISFADMDSNTIEQIIAKTYNMTSIDVWLKKEKRDDVRLILRKRKEVIQDFIEGKIKKIK